MYTNLFYDGTRYRDILQDGTNEMHTYGLLFGM